MFSKGNKYTCHFAVNFLCRGKNGKNGKAKTQKQTFLGAFLNNKKYLFIKFSTKPHIQLEMSLKLADFWPIPRIFFFLKNMVLKSPIILPQFSKKFQADFRANFYQICHLHLPRQTAQAFKTYATAIAVAIGMYRNKQY